MNDETPKNVNLPMVPRHNDLTMPRLQALIPQDFADVQRFAKMFIESPFCPDNMRNIASCSAAIMMGMEVGLTPMMAMQSIAVINGKPSIWGDGLLALAMSSDMCEDIDETLTGKGEAMVATCVVRRKGKKTPVTRSFSVEDAKLAGLWMKRGQGGGPTPWVTYPQRMLQMRARSWAIRDALPDILRGLSSAEEQFDVVQTSIEQEAPPPPSSVGSEPQAPAQPEAPSDHSRTPQPRSEGAKAAKTAKAVDGGKAAQEYLEDDKQDASFADSIFSYDDLAELEKALAELSTSEEIFAMVGTHTAAKVLTPSDETLIEQIVDRHLDRIASPAEIEPEPPAEEDHVDPLIRDAYQAGYRGSKRVVPKAYQALDLSQAYREGFDDKVEDRPNKYE